MYRICLIPGDGIGQEVTPEARRVLESTGLSFRFTEAEAGWATFETRGTSVPQETLQKIQDGDATLAGAFTSPSRKVEGHFGAIRYLRRTFDLFANLRPAKSRPVPGSFQGVDMLMVRENTQGLYVENERRYGDVAIADAVITRPASDRIARGGASSRRSRRRKSLAIVHKANVLPLTTGLFLETGRSKPPRAFPDVDGLRRDRGRRRHQVGSRAGQLRRDRHHQPVWRHPLRSDGGPGRRPGARPERQSGRPNTPSSNPFTAAPPTSPAAASPIPPPRSSPRP